MALKQIYIVLEGGCVKYVSSDSREVIDNIGVTLIDLDDLAGTEDLTDKAEMSQEHEAAEASVRIW